MKTPVEYQCFYFNILKICAVDRVNKIHACGLDPVNCSLFRGVPLGSPTQALTLVEGWRMGIATYTNTEGNRKLKFPSANMKLTKTPANKPAQVDQL